MDLVYFVSSSCNDIYEKFYRYLFLNLFNYKYILMDGYNIIISFPFDSPCLIYGLSVKYIHYSGFLCPELNVYFYSQMNIFLANNEIVLRFKG